MSDDIARFKAAMKHNSDNFAEWAGGERLYPEDRDIVGGTLCPDGGDWAVYDARGQTGIIGVHHDNWSDIHPVKLKSAKKFGVNLRAKPIARRVSTIDLMHRYRWIANVFLNWLHVHGGSPFDIWSSTEDIAAAYQAEAADFPDDPHLALYWLMHFGLCCDPRYDDVAQAIRANGHDQTLENARLALAFFDGTGVDHDVDLTPGYNPQGKDYSRLFLRRRANLLFWTYSLSYRGSGAAEPIWTSVSLSRGPDTYALLRMRWLVNNLKKYDLWDVLGERVLDPQNDDIPFISYPRLLHPTQPGGTDMADALVQELLATRPLWANRYTSFATSVLHDIRMLVGDKPALKAAALTIFDGDLGNERLADILQAVGEDAYGDATTRNKLAEFEALFEGLRSLRKPDQTKPIFAAADQLLSGLDAAGLLFFVGATTGATARQALLRYLILTPVADQEDHIVSLYPRAAFTKYDLKYVFDPPERAAADKPDQPLARAMLRILALPVESYSAAHLRDWAIEAACRALRPVAHAPGMFEQIMSLIEAATPADLPEMLFQHLFNVEHEAPHQPLKALEVDQLTRLVTAGLAYATANPDRFHDTFRLVQRCTEHCPQLVSSPSTPVFKALTAFLKRPAAHFDKPKDHSDAISAASLATLPQLHQEPVFDAMLDLVDAGHREVFKSGIFAFYMGEYNVTPKLTQPQVERLLNTCLAQLRAYPDDTREALRSIGDCTTPNALPWIKKALSDSSVLSVLDGIKIDFLPAAVKVEGALQYLLEDIEEADET